MKRNVAEMWVEALRSGEYDQGRFDLKICNFEGVDYCCLGVLCEIAIKEGVDVMETLDGWRQLPIPPGDGIGRFRDTERKRDQLRYFGSECDMLPDEVVEWAGMRSRLGVIKGDEMMSLASMNDVGCTFEEIADKIEENMEDL